MPKRKILKSKKSIVYFVIAVCAVLAVLINGISNGFDYKETARNVGVVGQSEIDKYPISVHFIDVGQGDCTLITSSFGTVLVDSGEAEEKDDVESYLDSLDIDKIDYLFLTHPHSDHCGSMSGIVDDYEIGKFYTSEIDEDDLPTTKCYENLLVSLDKKDIDCEYLHYGDEVDIGEITCTALGPIDIVDNLNSMSLVLKFEYKDFSVLITGDAETDEEKDILKTNSDLSADVLKVGHHGSSSSTSKKFLEAVNPQYAVISVGKDNSYNHPNNKIIDKLEENNIIIYRTDNDSTVVFSYNFSDIIVS